jgi:hypothetical protein
MLARATTLAKTSSLNLLAEAMKHFVLVAILLLLPKFA